MKKRMVTTFSIFLLMYVGVAAYMYVAQRSFQYHPQESLAAGFEVPAKFGLDEFAVAAIGTDDGQTLAAWFGEPSSAEAPVIVYFHGNAGTLGARADRFRIFRASGYGVLAISWRGFGGSTGAPSEAGLIQDGRGAISFLENRGVSADRLILFGESLGSGVVVQLAADPAIRPAAVVLDSPFTSAAEMARMQYWYLPVGLLMTDQFRSDLFAPKVTAPVMVVHGTADRVTPFRLGKALSDLFAGPTTFHPLDGAPHVADLTPESWGAIKAFLEQHELY